MLRIRIPVAILAFVVLGVVVQAQSQPTAEISGRITDLQGGVIPGARILVNGPQVRREVITDVDGHFLAGDLALGAYRVEVLLAGFHPRSGTVTLSAATPRAHLAWSIEVGCLMNPLRVRFTPLEAASRVEHIVHVRVVTDRGQVSWSARPECFQIHQSYATVVLNGNHPRPLELMVRLDDIRLQEGQEYLAFVWPGSFTGDDLVFPVVSGRVAASAPAPIGGLTVAEALAVLNKRVR